MQNVVSVGDVTVKIAGKNRPFSNNFTVREAHLEAYNGVDEVVATVVCTEDSQEPGRIYKCIWSVDGLLQECFTLN